MEKSPDAFRTISEVADDLDVPQHVLRFWESKFSQVRPMKRGGGRRYYRPNDVALLRGIRQLLYGEGYTIRGVQKLLRERGVAFVSERAQAEAGGPVDALDASPAAPAEAVSASSSPQRKAEAERAVSDRGGVIGEPALTADQREVLRAALAELAEAKRLLSGK